MTEHEKNIIADAINLDGLSGIQTSVNSAGSMKSNYGPYKRYFMTMKWTQEHADYAIQKWKEVHGEGSLIE